MHVVIAPDSFGGTLSAPEAAAAIATGWSRAAPGDTVQRIPLADGGPGFVSVLHGALGGDLRELIVAGPLPGQRVPARWLRVEQEGLATGYLEAAQACGSHLLGATDPHTARIATSRGVGELIVDAIGRDPGVHRLVVGLGGSACTDGGAGALAALGAVPVDADGADLPDGGAALARVAALRGAPELPVGVELVLATDVDNPLLGKDGAAAVFGPQKGADRRTVVQLEAALLRYLDVLAGATGGNPFGLGAAPGAGAAGGLGAALLALGAERLSGAELVRELTGLDAALDRANLVLTGEGSFDWQSLRGKLVTAVAHAAAERGLPCVVLAGRVAVGRREAASIGVQETHSVAEHVGGAGAAMADPAATLADLAAVVAGQWSGSR